MFGLNFLGRQCHDTNTTWYSVCIFKLDRDKVFQLGWKWFAYRSMAVFMSDFSSKLVAQNPVK